MAENIWIRYTITLDTGKKVVFELKLDPNTLNLVRDPAQDKPPPEWASLAYKACDNCALDKAKHQHCPVAVNLSSLVEPFGPILSYQECDVMVETAQRTVFKHMSAQDALSSLAGIYMVCSECPTLAKLKPLVRFHQPFAGIDETVYRVITMYVTAQYLRMQRGLAPDWELKGLHQMYEEISKVNQSVCKRMQDAAKEDAVLNSIVALDMFAAAIKMPTPERVEALLHLFAPYLK
ncbi:MAG: hypothetical protein HY078_06490 [Elusimicrobia bacterium]|nr:hypothetical protein [Elusimicrobiota bacterium]